MDLPNRVELAIIEARTAFDLQLASGKITRADLDKASKGLDLDAESHATLQEAKSAYTGSRLTLEEAISLYCYLGNSVSVFNRQPVEVKAAVMMIIAALIRPLEGAHS